MLRSHKCGGNNDRWVTTTFEQHPQQQLQVLAIAVDHALEQFENQPSRDWREAFLQDIGKQDAYQVARDAGSIGWDTAETIIEEGLRYYNYKRILAAMKSLEQPGSELTSHVYWAASERRKYEFGGCEYNIYDYAAYTIFRRGPLVTVDELDEEQRYTPHVLWPVRLSYQASVHSQAN